MTKHVWITFWMLVKLKITFYRSFWPSPLGLGGAFDGFVDRIAIIAENGALVQYKGEVLFESKLDPKDYLKLQIQP